MVRDQSGGILSIKGASRHTEDRAAGPAKDSPPLCLSLLICKVGILRVPLIESQGLNEMMLLKVLVWWPGTEQELSEW